MHQELLEKLKTPVVPYQEVVIYMEEAKKKIIALQNDPRSIDDRVCEAVKEIQKLKKIIRENNNKLDSLQINICREIRENFNNLTVANTFLAKIKNVGNCSLIFDMENDKKIIYIKKLKIGIPENENECYFFFETKLLEKIDIMLTFPIEGLEIYEN